MGFDVRAIGYGFYDLSDKQTLFLIFEVIVLRPAYGFMVVQTGFRKYVTCAMSLRSS